MGLKHLKCYDCQTAGFFYFFDNELLRMYLTLYILSLLNKYFKFIKYKKGG